MRATSNPARTWIPITPHNTNLIPANCRAIMIAVGGNVKYVDHFGDTYTVTLPAGLWPVVNVSIIWATGTTATGFSAAYDTDQTP